MNDIIRPEKYTPGMTDNFVSNEIIVPGLTAAKVWAKLIDTSLWPSYHDNASNIIFLNGKGTELGMGTRFALPRLALTRRWWLLNSCRQRMVNRPGYRGMAGWKGRRKWVRFRLGCLRICPAAACECSRKNHKPTRLRKRWPSPNQTPCLTPIKTGLRDWQGNYGSRFPISPSVG